MKRIAILFSFLLCIVLPMQTKAQCLDFAEYEAAPLLGEYILAGKLNAISLFQGEEILIFKTLSKGLKYRIIVNGDRNFPDGVEFTIEDWFGHRLFDNSLRNGASVWDYTCDETQRIKIFVKVPPPASGTATNVYYKGCVALLVGVMSDTL